MVKRFIMAALLWAAFSFPASAEGIGTSTILKPLTSAHALYFISTASRTITASFMPDTEVVRVVCTVACFIQTSVSGRTPVATIGGATSSIHLPANWAEYIQVPGNGKIAAIGLSSAGTLYVQEFGR